MERRLPLSRAAAALCALLAAGCASIAPPAPPAAPRERTAESPPSAPAAASVPAVLPPAATAPAQPPTGPTPEARGLQPFEGERVVVQEVLPRVATLDRTAPVDDLWQRIRRGFAMPNLYGPLVVEKTAWYAARPEYLRRMFERSRRYLYHIVEELEQRGLPTELALLPMVESSYNPMAYSRAHAAGLWQFIPQTGRRYDLKQNWWYDARRDIIASTAAALDYLQDLYKMHGDWQLALASYNWGENAVARALEKNREGGLPLEYAHLAMPLETRHYVPKLQALKNIIANPEPFGIELDPIPNRPYFTAVAKRRDIDVRLAAKLAEMPIEEFVALNPGFNRPVIRTDMTPRIVLPADRVAVFHANLSRYDEQALVSWRTYEPKKGETLEAIARRHRISLAQLKEVNGIGPRVRQPPAVLIVPAPGAAIDLRRLPLMYAPPIPVREPRLVHHRVVKGETLATIAAKYSVSIEDLRRWNRIGRLAVGQKLTIQARAAAPKPKPLVTKQAKSSARPDNALRKQAIR